MFDYSGNVPQTGSQLEQGLARSPAFRKACSGYQGTVVINFWSVETIALRTTGFAFISRQMADEYAFSVVKAFMGSLYSEENMDTASAEYG